jgi:hypothetical protein
MRERHGGQPAPVHVQPPLEQSVKEHVAPAAHCRVQWPDEHETVHVEPAAHAVRQPPLEQATLHVAPGGHEVLQFPVEQSMVHVPFPQ